MRLRFLSLVLPAFYFLPVFAFAHHPGADLDKVMGSREKFFQTVDKASAPSFKLADANGKTVRLSDFANKIVVINFIYAGCPDVCPLHTEKIARIQALLQKSPMKDIVQFITITTDPENDTPDVLRKYGQVHGLDARNWVFLTTRNGQSTETTRKLAQDYGMEFTKTDDGLQMHGVVTHIIDMGGRYAAKFHGLRFEPVNVVLYINGLINNANAPAQPSAPSWWERFKGFFR